MRHPGIQCEDRLSQLLPKLKFYATHLRSSLIDQTIAEDVLTAKRKEVDEARDKYTKTLSLINRLSRAEKVWPWGLPTNITIAEFESIAGENSTVFSVADKEAEAKRLGDS